MADQQRGLKMSRKGPTNTNNNGGAQAPPHGLQVFIKNDGTVEGQDVKYLSNEAGVERENVDCIQHGGCNISQIKVEALGSLAEFMDVSSPVSDCGAETQSDNVSNNVTSQTQDNVDTEWVKTEGVEGYVFLDRMTMSMSCPTSREESRSNEAMPLFVASSWSDDRNIATGDVDSSMVYVPVVVPEGKAEPEVELEARKTCLALPDDGEDSILVKVSDFAVLGDNDPESESPDASSVCAAASKAEIKSDVKAASMENVNIDRLVGSQSLTIDHSQLSSQDRACLEEIERGSQLTAEEEELMEDRRKELQALEFQTLADQVQDKNVDLTSQVIAPQDLQALPEQGLDIEPDLQTKPTVLARGEKADLQLSVSDLHKLLGSTSTASIQSTSGAAPSETSSISVQSDVILPADAAAPNSGSGMATVQITTDSVNNTTQIVVNTGSGLQLYQVNTADLDQAADAFQPLFSQHTGQQKVDETTRVGQGGASTKGPVPRKVEPAVSAATAPQTTSAGKTPPVTSLTGLRPLTVQNTHDKQDNNEKSWACTIEDCGQTFSKPSQLKVHLMNHMGDRPFKCPVEGCHWAFTTGHKLKRHQEAHQGEKNYTCAVAGCGKKFTTIYNLRTHSKLHMRQNTLECPQVGCGEKFAMQKQLDQHLKTHGSDLKTYKCPYEGCERRFYSRLCMGSHTRVHQRHLDLTCHFEGCGKVFEKLCRLKAHLRSHTGERPYPCTVEGCNWAFATSSKLRRHLQKHTGERQYECPHEGCGKRFMRAEHLKGHLIIHTGTKPFACCMDGCDARFTAKSTLYVHLRKHRQNACQKVRYFCPLEGCSQKYNNKAALRAHIEKHYQKPLPTATGDVSFIPVLDVADGMGDTTQQQQQQIETTGTSHVQEVAGLITLDGAAVNPADLLAAGDQPILLGPGGGSLLTFKPSLTGDPPTAKPLATIPITIDLGNGLVTQVALQGVLNPVQRLVAVSSPSSAGAMTTASGAESSATGNGADRDDSPQVIVAPDIDRGPPPGDATSGSARTDYHSNHMLSSRAKLRQQLIRGDATLEQAKDVSESSSDMGKALSTAGPVTPQLQPSQTRAVFSLSDMMTSQAITFRDPETGAIYVQTQLLQDDPPNPEAFDDTGMDTSDQSGLEAELSSILQDSHGGDIVDGSGGSGTFSGSTINLQDLE